MLRPTKPWVVEFCTLFWYNNFFFYQPKKKDDIFNIDNRVSNPFYLKIKQLHIYLSPYCCATTTKKIVFYDAPSMTVLENRLSM